MEFTPEQIRHYLEIRHELSKHVWATYGTENSHIMALIAMDLAMKLFLAAGLTPFEIVATVESHPFLHDNPNKSEAH